MIMAILMAVGVLFVAASCGGPKTYKFDSVDVKAEGASEETAALISGIAESIKPELEKSMKNAELVIDGDKITMKDDKESKTLECKRNGDRLEFPVSELQGMLSGLDSGNLTAYVLEKNGASLNFEMEQSIMSLSLKILITVNFR